jgi:hypothetical protein
MIAKTAGDQWQFGASCDQCCDDLIAELSPNFGDGKDQAAAI